MLSIRLVSLPQQRLGFGCAIAVALLIITLHISNAEHFDDEPHVEYVSRKDDAENLGGTDRLGHLDPQARNLPRPHPAQGLRRTGE